MGRLLVAELLLLGACASTRPQLTADMATPRDGDGPAVLVGLGGDR